MPGAAAPRLDPHEPLLADAHAVADGVFDQRLQRQGRQGEVAVPDVVFHADRVEAHLFDVRVDARVLQLLGEGDALRLAERIEFCRR